VGNFVPSLILVSRKCSILCMEIRLRRAYCLMRYDLPLLVILAWDFPGWEHNEFIPRVELRFVREGFIVAVKAVAFVMGHPQILRYWDKESCLWRTAKTMRDSILYRQSWGLGRAISSRVPASHTWSRSVLQLACGTRVPPHAC
jgi:hypothetical protein